MVLRDLEKKLYEKKFIKREREEGETSAQDSVPDEIGESWRNGENTDSAESQSFISLGGRRAILIMGGILLVILTLVGYFLYQFFSVKEVDFKITAPEQVRMGMPFDLVVSFSNDSTRVLKDARIAFSLPKGAVLVGRPASQNVENRTLGDIGAGSFIKETFRAMFVGDVNILKNFDQNVNVI